MRGAVAALVGGFLTLFGVIHAPTVGLAQPHAMPLVYAYCMIAGVFVLKHYLNLREADRTISAGEMKPAAQASKA